MSDKEEKSFEGSEKPWWSEAVRDLTSAGLAAFFMTEDSVRSYLKEKKFPKEMVGLLLEGIKGKKDDLYGLIAKEVGRVLSKMDLSAELSKFLENHRVHLEAKISFEPRTSEAKPMASPHGGRHTAQGTGDRRGEET